MSDRHSEIAAALERWTQAYRFHELEAAGKEMASLLRAELDAEPASGAEEARYCTFCGCDTPHSTREVEG